MLGTFGLRPKGTMSARALGIATALREHGWQARIGTVPWDCPEDAGTSGSIDGVEYQNTRTVRPTLWPLAVNELVRLAREYRPDLIHLFKPKGFGDLAARLLQRSGYPVVVDMDDWEGDGGWNDALPYSRVQRRLFDWQERTWPARADGVTVASRTLYRRALDLGASGDSTTYIPNGLTRQRFAELANPAEEPTREYPSLAITGASNVLLYTRFVEFDPGFAVQVLSGLAQSVPNARLVVAGGSSDGLPETLLTSHAQRAGLGDRVTSLGWIDPRDLGWIAGQCSAALVPFDDTLINRAKCSVKLLELMACGIPIVASAVGENREYLRDYSLGFLARPGDPESHSSALASLIARTVTSEEPKQPLGRAEPLVRKYLWEQLVTMTLAMYEYALDGHSKEISPWN